MEPRIVFSFHRGRELISLFPGDRDDLVSGASQLPEQFPNPVPGWRPVTMTLGMVPGDLAGGRNGQGRDKVYRRRYFVPGQLATAELQDLALQFIRSPGRGARLLLRERCPQPQERR